MYFSDLGLEQIMLIMDGSQKVLHDIKRAGLTIQSSLQSNFVKKRKRYPIYAHELNRAGRGGGGLLSPI